MDCVPSPNCLDVQTGQLARTTNVQMVQQDLVKSVLNFLPLHPKAMMGDGANARKATHIQKTMAAEVRNTG